MAEKLTNVQKNRRKFIFTSWTGAAILAGIVLLLNFVFSYLPLRLDTSEGQIYSISKGTKNLVSELEDTLLVRMVFSSRLPPQFKLNERYIYDLLQEYRKASGGKVRVEYLDPSASPKNRQEAMQSGVAPVQLDVRARDRREVQECFMGLSFIYGDQSDVIPFIQDTRGMEYQITQRIKKLVSPGEVKIAVVSNAESLTLDDAPLKQLGGAVEELFKVEEIDLNEPIPTGLRAIWLLGPKKELQETEIAALKQWVERGGALGLLIDQYDIDVAQFRATPVRHGLNTLLRAWGLEQRKGLAVDPRSDRIQIQSKSGFIQWVNVVEFPYFPLVTDLNRENPVTKGIDAISLPFVSPISIIREDAGLTYTSLGKTSDQSWLNPAPSNLSPLQKHVKFQGATEGPFDVAVSVEGAFAIPEEGKEVTPGRIIVVGSSRFMRTDFPPRPQNYSFFLNLLDWSVQDEALLAIRAKGVTARPLKRITNVMRITLKYLLMFGLPVFVVVFGLVIWRRQKTRRALLPLKYGEVS